ncbi:MAG: 3-deoxy-manno-octulosonate cytidylyltransferase [Burkholderiales bacterium]
MKFTVIIPARYGSSRFPGKPLAELAGRPMVVHVAERARESGASEVIVATDHAGIESVVRSAGYDVVMTRSDHASGTDRLGEVITRRRFDGHRIVVNVQGDEPLVAPALIRRVAESLSAHEHASIATACHPIATAADVVNPNVVKVVLDREGYALYFSRAPIPFARDAYAKGVKAVPKGLPVYRHLGIYAYRVSFLREFRRLKPAPIEQFEALEQLRALYAGYRVSVTITRSAPHAGVDTPADLARAQAHLARRRRVPR